MNRQAVVTGMGAVSTLGIGTEALWAGVESGFEGLQRIERFSTEGFSVHHAYLVPGFNAPIPRGERGGLATEFGVMAGREALAQAQLAGSALPRNRIAMVLGTNRVLEEDGPHELAREVAQRLEVRGPCLGVVTACAASTGAMGLALELLASGAADAVLAGGVDALNSEVFAGFHALGVLSTGPCAPFSEPGGTVLGEGSGFVVLERREQAEKRGVKALAGVWGYGLSSDAYHETSPEPGGSGVARALRGALADAGVEASEVGYVNAHGTGTEANDAAESRGLAQVFGSGFARLPVSSSKSFLGHALGAAGALELIVSLLALSRQVVPPTRHFGRPRPHAPPDPVGEGAPRAHAYRHGLSNSAAFGGVNSAVVFGVPAAAPSNSGWAPAPVWVRGLGVVGAHGAELAAFGERVEQGGSWGGPAPELAIEKLVRSADPRRLDPSARFLCMATALALADAGTPIRGDLRDRSGLVVGSSRLSPATELEFRRSVEERGLARLSASSFARRVLCAPAGNTTRLLTMRGPTSTLATGVGSGLAAVASAALMLSTRKDADLLVAGGVDERARDEPNERGEGAACVVLSRGRAPGDRAPIQLVGVGLGPGGEVGPAIERALSTAGVAPSEVGMVYGPGMGNGLAESEPTSGSMQEALESSGAVFGLVAAVLALRNGRARTALVTTAGETVSVAVLMRRLE